MSGFLNTFKHVEQAEATTSAGIKMTLRSSTNTPATLHSSALLSQIPTRSQSRRRRLMLSMAAGLTLGILIPIAFMLPLYPVHSPQAAELAQPSSLHISVAKSHEKVMTVSSTELARQAAARSVADTKPSDVIDYVSQQAPSIAPREYIYVSSEHRLYRPEMYEDSSKIKNSEVRLSESDLHSVPASGGRFKTARNDIEWQGGWSFKNPEHNLKLGSTYSQYLEGGFGSLQNKLSVVSSQNSKILNGLELRGAGPSGLSR